jgi:dethiobiotin synthetase
LLPPLVPSSGWTHSLEVVDVRPERLVVVTGTGTEIGKTWVGAALLAAARDRGWSVAARKPVQSFDPLLGEPTDADVLSAASGESPSVVCIPSRCYPRAVAPPMAADVLGHPPLRLGDLVDELVWPDAAVQLGLVEGAGGLRSPLAVDGDTRELVERLDPDHLLLVADAGLGTLHAVRAALDALAGSDVPVTVMLNRFDPEDPVHAWNLDWLLREDGTDAVVAVDELLDRWSD